MFKDFDNMYISSDLRRKYKLFSMILQERKIDFLVTCTYRSQEEQDKLYAQGRTLQGKIVTKVKNSKHTEGAAFDIAILKNGKISWENRDYIAAGLIGMAVGLRWGGDFDEDGIIYEKDTFIDAPHFELK